MSPKSPLDALNYAGGSPNFDETTGRYRSRPSTRQQQTVNPPSAVTNLDSLVSNASDQLAANAANRRAAGGGADSTAVWNDGNLNVSLGTAPTPTPTDTRVPGIRFGGGETPTAKKFSGSVDAALATKQQMPFTIDDMRTLLTPQEMAAVQRATDAGTSWRARSYDDDALLASARNKITKAFPTTVVPGGGGGGGGGGRGGGGSGKKSNKVGGGITSAPVPGSTRDNKPPKPAMTFDQLPKLPAPKVDTGWRTLPNGNKIKIGEGGSGAGKSTAPGDMSAFNGGKNVKPDSGSAQYYADGTRNFNLGL